MILTTTVPNNSTYIDRFETKNNYTVASPTNLTEPVKYDNIDWTRLLSKGAILTDNVTADYPIQTVFRVGDYTPYEQNTDSMDSGTRTQNQMLPIYCSLMGLIIVFLLFYVVYKLWRQREAMANAKLTEGYLVHSCNGIKGHTSLHHSVQIPSSTGSVVMSHRGELQTDKLSIKSHSSTTRPSSTRQGGVETNFEQDPLLHGTDETILESGGIDKPLRSLPSIILGELCFRLAQNGWNRLGTALGMVSDTSLDFNKEAQYQYYYNTILQAALDTQASQPVTSDLLPIEHPNEVDHGTLNHAVGLVSNLCVRPSVTLNCIVDALRNIDRADLVPLMTEDIGSNLTTVSPNS